MLSDLPFLTQVLLSENKRNVLLSSFMSLSAHKAYLQPASAIHVLIVRINNGCETWRQPTNNAEKTRRAEAARSINLGSSMMQSCQTCGTVVICNVEQRCDQMTP